MRWRSTRCVKIILFVPRACEGTCQLSTELRAIVLLVTGACWGAGRAASQPSQRLRSTDETRRQPATRGVCAATERGCACEQARRDSFDHLQDWYISYSTRPLLSLFNWLTDKGLVQHSELFEMLVGTEELATEQNAEDTDSLHPLASCQAATSFSASTRRSTSAKKTDSRGRKAVLAMHIAG